MASEPGTGPEPTASTGPLALPYPERWEADVALVDGGTFHVRPILPTDGGRMGRFHERQSPESIYFRYFSPRPRLSDADIERFTNVDYRDRMAFVGLLGDELIGIARYDRHLARSDAEVAFFTDDEHHGRGLATVLLEYLAAAAREVGISGFTASVLPENRRMLSVFKQAGFEVHSHFADGIVEVELAIEPTPEALELMEARAATAEARSVERLLAPTSIAVIGASRQPGTIGHDVFRHLIDRGFEGPVYPVNSDAGHVHSVRTYASILEVPDDIDLAVVAVPADQVFAVVEQCAVKRVHGLVILSAGFAESGEEGRARERGVVEAARRRGMRVIGPNCMGVVNTSPMVSMHATFVDIHPLPGTIGFSSQSGTIGAAVLDRAAQLGLGISTFVAMGNKADVSGNDLLRYWHSDDRTRVVLLYLESFGNPRNFSRIARQLSQQKPIVAVKSGRSLAVDEQHQELVDAAGWPVEVSVDAMLRQTGIIRVDTLEQVFDVCRLLVHQPLPQGRRVAVLSNVWSPAVLASDACIAAGLLLAEMAEDTKRVLVARLRAGARVTNPVELTIEAGPAEYAAAAKALLADPGVDAVLVLYVPPLRQRAGEVAKAVAAVADHPTKPVVAAYFGRHPDGDRRDGDGDGVELPGIPRFAFPEGAARALGRVAEYAEWQRRPHGTVPQIDGVDDAADLVVRFLGGPQDQADGAVRRSGVAVPPEGRWLAADEAAELLATVGVAAMPYRLVGSAEEAVTAANAIGYPVAIKATGLARLAKTEAGGVALDVHGDDEVREAHRRMSELLGPAMQPSLVQAMGPSGVECWVGVHQHPAFGSVVTFGPGALAHQSVEQMTMRILPLTDADAAWLVGSSTVAGPINALGPAAAEAVEDLLLRVAALAEAVPEVSLLRLNPVIVSAAGTFITDARIRLAPWHTDPEPAVRRLS